MARFATDADLSKIIPDIFDHGSESFEQELEQAEDDIIRRLKVDWYNKRYSPNTFKEQNLDASQWERATCYRALANHILPRLSQWRPDGDAFREQMKYYKERAQEEYDLVLSEGINYDKDSDGTFDIGEKYEYDRSRLWR